ncbi:MAG: hypothetical protein AAGB31_07685 [Bdellovibrio sp.]
MRPLNTLFFLTTALIWSPLGTSAQSLERERLSGFAEHQKDLKQFDRAREKGERAYWEAEEQKELQKIRELEEYKKNKKPVVQDDENSPEALADAREKRAQDDKREKERLAYIEKKEPILNRQSVNLPSEEQELGLDELRPRYDYRKRAMFGAQPKYGKSFGSGGSSGSGSGSSSGSFGGSGGGSMGGGSSFPAPPTFDDFGGAPDGFVPSPMDDFGDIPPPPPPPPLDMDDAGGGFSSPVSPLPFNDGSDF